MSDFLSRLAMNVRPDSEVDEYERRAKMAEHEKHVSAVVDLMGAKFKHSTFDSYECDKDTEKVVAELEMYAIDPRNETVMLLGNVGTGKTHLAAAILKACRWSPGYISMREACIDLQVSRSFKAHQNTKEVLETYSRVGMLVIDEIGRGSDVADEKLFLSYVLNARYENNRPTVLISNLGWDAVKTLLGADIIDRITETGKSYKLGGESYRKKIAGGME